MTQKKFRTPLTHLLTAIAALGLAACGSGDDGADTPEGQSHTVGGQVTGLGAGKSLVLRNNGAGDLAVAANGGFTFGARQAIGSAYAVTVATQPDGQICSVTRGSGTIADDVTDVAVACGNATTPPPSDPVLAIGDYVGDWAGGPCARATNGTYVKTLVRASRLSDNSVRYEQGGVVFDNSACTGAGTVPLAREAGTVTFDGYKATAAVGAAYGTWAAPIGANRVVWAKKGSNLLCVLADATPTLFPTAQSVETYLGLDSQQNQNCYARR